MSKEFLESNTIRDEDAVIRVMTDKGAVCMTAEQYDEYSSGREGKTSENQSENLIDLIKNFQKV